MHIPGHKDHKGQEGPEQRVVGLLSGVRKCMCESGGCHLEIQLYSIITI